ncbi:type II secretion system F family protein [bacterium]|nr:type II secretion system F family protein [bacterium]NCQ55296.1 type II secretion system F family protein [Candidatus Parcubacteria bacterium]NCS67191.1 type II secretion system F family protein [Candidatus Peregrinibacteria bacterium]NCS96817.1 type II secretion system F family protein [bacterium]
MATAIKKSTETKYNTLDLLKNPKQREVIYGLTDRRKDHWLIQTNDYLLDHQPFNLKDKARFFHSLKLLVNSGVQFTRALEMLAARTQHVRFSRVLKTVAYDMQQNGLSFSGAIQKHPAIFSESEVKMVYSGELTGKINATLEAIATQLQKNIELEMRVKSALMYPATVVAAIILAGAAVMFFIVPKLTSLFAELGGELPLSTRILMGASDFLVNFWWLLLFVIAGVISWFIQWKNSEEGKRSWHRFILDFPPTKELVSNIQVTKISQNFATLMAAGIPLSKALRVMGEIIPNKIIGDDIFDIEMKVRNGASLHQSFLESNNIDSVVGEILEVGEKTGHMAEVLQKLGDQYDLEVEAQLKNLSTVIEPIIILFVGVAVAFLIFAVLMPIFGLQDLFASTA